MTEKKIIKTSHKDTKIALAGNPNSGKTTLFNALTGSNQYVGNWPGVTVEKKEGRVKGRKHVVLTDLPGIYSLSPYTLEEIVTRNYLIKENPDAIINIVDGTNIERNLYLTTQLLELGIPVIIAVNMMDIVRREGDEINIEKLGQTFGCKAVEISALKSEGIQDLIDESVEIARSNENHNIEQKFEPDVEDAISVVSHMLSPDIKQTLKRFFAIKVLAGDAHVKKHLVNYPDAKDLIKPLEEKYDDTMEAILINQRYNYITSVVKTFVKKKRGLHDLSISDKIDKILTGKFLAIPIFVVIMFAVYYIAMNSVGGMATSWLNNTLFGEWIQPAVQTFLESQHVAKWLISLVVEGIIGGLATPISFVPQMAILFFLLSILEDCGYMARIAFIMDKLFYRFGLSGKSFIPFLVSSGCGVPGIMSTRTIENERDRKLTMITTTFIPCGAKLPVIALIGSFIMGGNWWIAPVMYFLGIVSVIISCVILKKTKRFSGKPSTFVMELPHYHIPSLKNVLILVWDRIWSFIKKIGTILFICVVIMWFLGSFGFKDGAFGMVDTSHSLISYIGGFFAWLFVPLGFGNWQSVAASISGIVAKEGIVSTMGVLSGLGNVHYYSSGMREAFATFFKTPIAAFSFLTFNLLASPCIAALSTLYKEIGSKKDFLFAIIYQNIYAYCMAFMIYQFVGLILGMVTFGIATVAAGIVFIILMYLLFRKPRVSKVNGR